MHERDDSLQTVIGSPGKVAFLQFNLGTPKAGTTQAVGTFVDDFGKTKHLLAPRPLKGIDPPKRQ